MWKSVSSGGPMEKARSEDRSSPGVSRVGLRMSQPDMALTDYGAFPGYIPLVDLGYDTTRLSMHRRWPRLQRMAEERE